jgi:hypothetical protein
VEHLRTGPAEDFFGFVTIEPPCPFVPKENFPIQILADKGILGRRVKDFHYECQRVFGAASNES